MQKLLIGVFLILLSRIGLGRDGCKVEDACPWQGNHVEEAYQLYFSGLGSKRPCIFRALRGDGECAKSQESLHETHGGASVPDSQLWSRCMHCGWDSTKERFIVFSTQNSSQNRRLIDLSWSNWGEFFHDRNDFLQAEVETVYITGNKDRDNDNVTSYMYVDRPVFIIPMITFHPGHILVDILEQVYGAMIKAYGRVRRDSLLIFDVAYSEERRVLQEKLSANSRHFVFNPISRTTPQSAVLYDGRGKEIVDTFGSALEILTELPILSIDALNYVDMNGKQIRLLFSDVHVGLDSSSAFFHKGHRNHPCVWSNYDESNFQFQQTKEDYIKFYEYVHSFYGREVPRKTDKITRRHGRLKLSIVQRTARSERYEEDKKSLPNGALLSGNRQIVNLHRLLERARSSELLLSTRSIVLEAVPFSEQRKIFWDTDIMMAVAGSALHNLLYLKRDSAVIIIMQRGWGPWAWMYANQAKLLGMSVLVYFDGDPTPRGIASSHWSRRFWTHGPRGLKDSNIHLSEDTFIDMVVVASAEIRAHGKEQGNATTFPSFFGAALSGETSFCFEDMHTFVVKDASEDQEDSHAASENQNDRTKHDDGAPLIRVLVTGIRSTLVPESGKWLVFFSGIFEYEASSYMNELFASMPHLCMCMRLLGDGDPLNPPACVLLESFNYYANINLQLGLEDTEQVIHIWLQSSVAGGTLLGSDAFVALDQRVLDGGWLLSHHLEEATGQMIPNPCQLDSISVTTGEEGGFYSFSLSSPLSFQRELADLRSSEGLTPQICGQIVAAVSAKLLHCQIALNLPRIQHLPSPEAPFVFLHIEKTGGTTLREFITEAADRLALDYLVPCHGGIHCTVLDLSFLRETGQQKLLGNASIVAGHFFWGVWNELPRYLAENRGSQDGGTEGDTASQVPSCLVMSRHPVDRAISYYYERCYNNALCIGHHRLINDLSRDELMSIAQQERNGRIYPQDPSNRTIVILDEGMSDASCRALTGSRATSGLKYTIPGESPGGGEFRVHTTGVPAPHPLGINALEHARRNTAKCVIGLQERWKDTQAVIEHWFPWIGGFAHDPGRRKMHFYSGKEDRNSLLPDLKEALEGINPCDMALYEFQTMLFEYQIDAMKQKTLV